MRFIIYGAGAVGGGIGGRLFQAGHDVTLIARGDHLAALQRDGLTLGSPAGTADLRCRRPAAPASADPAPGDVVVLAMKSQHTAAAVADLAPAAPRGRAGRLRPERGGERAGGAAGRSPTSTPCR